MTAAAVGAAAQEGPVEAVARVAAAVARVAVVAVRVAVAVVRVAAVAVRVAVAVDPVAGAAVLAEAVAPAAPRGVHADAGPQARQAS